MVEFVTVTPCGVIAEGARITRVITRWGQNLERLRKARKMSKVGFAQLIGMSQQQLNDLIHDPEDRKISTLQRIVDKLGVDISELFRMPTEDQALVETHGTIGPPAETRSVLTFDNDNAIRLVVANTLAAIAARLAEEIMRSQADARGQAPGPGPNQSGPPPPDRNHGG